MKQQLLNKVEKFVAKGIITHHEQFLLVPQCFKKLSAAETLESFCMCEWVKHVSRTIFLLQCQQVNS